jgi:hypothetical protein
MWKNSPRTITNWEWLRLRLELYALRARSQAYSVDFLLISKFNAPLFESCGLGTSAQLACRIFAEQTLEMVDRKAPRAKQLEYYRDWAHAEGAQIQNILDEVRIEPRDFSIQRDVGFVIMYSYGMGGFPVCSITQKRVRWINTSKLTVSSKS